MSLYTLLQVLAMVGLVGLGGYYRKRRLLLLIEPTERRARGLLGVAGTLMLALAWLILHGLLDSHGQLLAGGFTPVVLTVVAVPMLVVIGLVMVVVAGRYSFVSVIRLLDALTGEPGQRR